MVLSVNPNPLAKITKAFMIGPTSSQSPVHISLSAPESRHTDMQFPECAAISPSLCIVSAVPAMIFLFSLLLKVFKPQFKYYLLVQANLELFPPLTTPNTHTHTQKADNVR